MALVLDEDAASRARDALAPHEVLAASAIAEVEARAGLARARRGRRLTARAERLAWTRFQRLWSSVAVVAVEHSLIQTAVALADDHGLRGYDAVQLASALRAADATASPAFACLDAELNGAAAEAGLTCVLA